MEQITCLQPKGPVAVSFLKNISAFFFDTTISQGFEQNRFQKRHLFHLAQEACQGKAFEKMSFHIYRPEQH